MNRLAGKYTLITGGSSGIGLATAREFIAEGATVAITGRNKDRLLAAKQELGADVIILQSDTSDVEEQKLLAAQLTKMWPRLDGVYINAADVTHLPVTDWNENTFDRVMNTNFKGPFFLIQALLPLLADPCSVILCGTVSTKIGLPQSSIYASSKAALCSLAKTLSGELLSRNIRFNCLVPGPTDTPAHMNLNTTDPDAVKHLQQEIKALVPLGRLGKPIELAKAAVFLASDESSFMLGTEILVDGGVGNI